MIICSLSDNQFLKKIQDYTKVRILAKMNSLNNSSKSRRGYDLTRTKILAGNSHPKLANDIASYLDKTVTKAIVDRFSNSEIRVQILENVRRNDVVIVQTGSQNLETGYSVNDYLMELLTMINACRLSSADDIIVVIPCFPYARQDKKDISRTPISGRMVADLIQKMGATRVIAVDFHAAQIAGFFKIPVDNFYTVGLMAEYLRSIYKLDDPQSRDNFVLVSPDEGGVKRMRSLGNEIGIRQVIMHKERDHHQKSKVLKTLLIGEKDCCVGKSCFIIDDICDTGGTICKASDSLMEQGAKDIRLLIVHGLFSPPALDRINKRPFIKEVITTDSVPQEANMKLCDKIRVVPIGPLLGEAVKRLQSGESISELFPQPT